eukprot:2846842-Pyramimonas_sp.AAC.1
MCDVEERFRRTTDWLERPRNRSEEGSGPANAHEPRQRDWDDHGALRCTGASSEYDNCPGRVLLAPVTLTVRFSGP